MKPPLTCLIPLLVACDAPETWDATGTLTDETFSSNTLGEDLVLRIRIPPGASDDDAFPVVFQLDPTFAGLRQFERTVGLVSEHAAAGDWPEAVVVGIDTPDPWRRFELYSPDPPLDPDFAQDIGPDAFYAALRDEVIPHVDATLPVDPDHRILQGHSQGGVFTWYAAFRHEAGTPPLFAAHVAADNGYAEELFTLERWHAERATDLPIALFTSRATVNGPGQSIVFDAMIERLEGRGYPGLELQTAVYETDHSGAVVPSYTDGLAFALGVTR